VTSDSVVALDLHIGAKSLARLVDFARGTIATERGDGEELWRAPLQRLHEYLIGPVERAGLLQGKRRLYVAPHADLHYLPFAALLAPETRNGFLIERFAISYTPSASVWAQLPAPAGPTAAGRLLMLAPVSPDALPGAALEARRIARAYGTNVTSLVGQEATEPGFRELVPDHQVVHLASFGVLNKQNPLFSYVALRPAGDEDGRLEVHEIFGLSLKADLVVLSACQTALGAGALGDVPAGDDWVGLVQAFLYAGSARVLATTWPVADRPTATLMTAFYEELRAGAPEDVALARAQRAALREAKTGSPLYWAGFVLTGGPQARIGT
jgi:CHAT domain-containing protein